MTIDDKINLVKNDMLERFPNCHYSIQILLWDDNTDSVECKHGRDNEIHISKFYDGKLTYEKYLMVKPFIGCMVDEYGNEYYHKDWIKLS